MTRLAITTGALTTVERYLPSNYTVVDLGPQRLIFGEDVAGWTLDDYVIPRLASGLISAREVVITEKDD